MGGRARIEPELFWSIIERSRARAEAEHPAADLAELAEAQTEHARELLARLPPAQIAGFQRFLDDRMADSYRRDLRSRRTAASYTRRVLQPLTRSGPGGSG